MGSVRVAIVLVAAGPGTRLGADRPKAFALLDGRPLLAHALDSMRAAAGGEATAIDELVVVAPASHRSAAEEIACRATPPRVSVVAGGAQRQDSVRAGLSACTAGIVVVHDAARPFVTAATLGSVITAAAEHGAAIAALPAVDTVKLVDEAGRVASTPERRRVWLAQTPQAFRRDVLLAAHAAAADNRSTDDASLVEALGLPVQVVTGDPESRKITTADDLRWADWLLRSGQWPR